MSAKKIHTATMFLPPNGKQAWTDIMQASVKVSGDIYETQPIVMSTAKFRNGIWVAGGVQKSATPDEYNIKFFHTFEKNGNLITTPYQPIDVSDHEDFFTNSITFILNDDESTEYILYVAER